MVGTIHGVLERNARKFPDKEAFITATNRLTYLQMNHICNRIARYLQEKGVKREDRIAILSKNNEHFFYAFFSIMKIGAIPIPVNVRLTSNELKEILHNANAAGVLYEKELYESLVPVKESVPMQYFLSIQDAVEESSDYPYDNLNLPIKSHDVCEILFTSGTTGNPKGVLYNHERILAVSAAITYEFGLSSEDRMLTLMPLTHSAPLNTFFLSGLYCGCSHVIGTFAPQEFLAWIDKEKTTFTFAAPVAYLMAAKEPNLSQYDLSSMRVFAYGGGPLALASYEHIKNQFHNENFYQVYGLTEAGPNGCLLRPEEHATKAGSIGKRPTINMEIRIVRPDGSDTSPYEYGEIIMAGDSLMIGYDHDPESTAEAVRDGWLYTGDVAYYDEDGYMFIIDRKKDIIISGGINIYPREIEEVLAKHPAVLESCVIGVPHEVWGETVKAVIVPKGEVTEAELRQFVSGYLADYKRPRLYSFVKELPRNASGKILRYQVKHLS